MRTAWIDIAKGVVIFLVVFAHVNLGLARAGIEIFDGAERPMYWMVANFAMPVFFFLAGLFTEHSINSRGKKTFILNKVETVVYPYIVFSLIQGLIEVALSKYTNMKISIAEVFTLFYMPRAQFWFLFALFLCFVVIAIVYRNSGKNTYLGVLFAISVVVYLATEEWSRPLQLAFVTNNIVFILAGMLYPRLPKFKASDSLLVLTILAFLAIDFLASVDRAYWEYRIVSLTVGMLGIAAAGGASVLLARTKPRILPYIGKLSMQIYLLHILACGGTRIILRSFLGIENWYVHIVLGTACGVLLPIVAYHAAMRLGFGFLFVCPFNLSGRKKSGQGG